MLIIYIFIPMKVHIQQDCPPQKGDIWHIIRTYERRVIWLPEKSKTAISGAKVGQRAGLLKDNGMKYSIKRPW